MSSADTWRPQACSRDELLDVSTLAWDHGTVGRFHVRGAICWPRLVEPNRYEGFFLVAGVQLDAPTGHAPVIVLDEGPFVCVRDIVAAGQMSPGLVSMVTRAWALFGCRRYFERDTLETTLRHHRDLRELPQCEPKPKYVEVQWTDDAAAVQLVLERVLSRTLVCREGGRVGEVVTRLVGDAGGVDLNREPALYALVLALHGFGARPWRAPRPLS